MLKASWQTTLTVLTLERFWIHCIIFKFHGTLLYFSDNFSLTTWQVKSFGLGLSKVCTSKIVKGPVRCKRAKTQMFKYILCNGLKVMLWCLLGLELSNYYSTMCDNENTKEAWSELASNLLVDICMQIPFLLWCANPLWGELDMHT